LTAILVNSQKKAVILYSLYKKPHYNRIDIKFSLLFNNSNFKYRENGMINRNNAKEGNTNKTK